MIDIVYKLRHPAWSWSQDGGSQLDKDETLIDLADAADEIERLRSVPAQGTPDAIEAAQFLLERLDEFDPGEDDAEREYHGHVAPAIARLRSALGGKP